MTRDLLIKRTVIVALLALIPCGSALLAHAADQPSAGRIPEVMMEQPSQPDVLTPEVGPGQAIWVDEIRSSSDIDRKSTPLPILTCTSRN